MERLDATSLKKAWLVSFVRRHVEGVMLSRLRCLGFRGGCTGAKGPGTRHHHAGGWCRKWVGTGGDGRRGPGGRGGSVLAGAAGAARGCWRRKSGLRSGHGGCGQGDGGVNEWQAQGS
jgi:hypothetical protein